MCSCSMSQFNVELDTYCFSCSSSKPSYVASSSSWSSVWPSCLSCLWRQPPKSSHRFNHNHAKKKDPARRRKERRVWTYVIPVLFGSSGQFLPPLDQEDAGVADVSTAKLTQAAETGSAALKRAHWCRMKNKDVVKHQVPLTRSSS